MRKAILAGLAALFCMLGTNGMVGLAAFFHPAAGVALGMLTAATTWLLVSRLPKKLARG